MERMLHAVVVTCLWSPSIFSSCFWIQVMWPLGIHKMQPSRMKLMRWYGKECAKEKRNENICRLPECQTRFELKNIKLRTMLYLFLCVTRNRMCSQFAQWFTSGCTRYDWYFFLLFSTYCGATSFTDLLSVLITCLVPSNQKPVCLRDSRYSRSSIWGCFL